METRIYGQSRLYRASTWLLVLGRVGAIATLPLFALFLWFPRSGGSVHPPGWWIVMIVAFGAVTFVAIWASVLLAALMRCDECRRRPTIVWTLRSRRSRPRTEWQAIKDDLYPPELRSGHFQCEHCGTQFTLLECSSSAS